MFTQAEMWLRPVLLSLILLVAYLSNPSHGFQDDCPMIWTEAVNYSVPEYFYPFPGNGTVVSPNDDGSSPAISLKQAFTLFGNRHDTIWVNTNGLLSVMGSFGTFTPQPFPIPDIVLIAIFWADVDTTRNDGRIYYEQTIDSAILCRFSNEVQEQFTEFFDFRATCCFIVTWHNVTYFGGSTNTPINTFQLIICTNGRHTFVQYKYGNITWTTGTASGGDRETGLGGIPAEVGFNSGNTQNFYAIEQSRTAAIVNLTLFDGNTGSPGCWIFRLDTETVTEGGCNTGGSLSVGPRFAKVNGRKKIFITGPCYDLEGDVIVCSFDGITVPGTIENERRACCFTPLYFRTGSVQLKLSTDNGTTFPFSTTFFFVQTDPAYTVTRQEPERWMQGPYTELRFTWDQNFFPQDALLDVDVVCYFPEEQGQLNMSQQGVVGREVKVMSNVVNSGEAMLPTNLSIAESLEINATVCAIRIKDSSILSEYLWSDVTASAYLWFMAMVFEELDIRSARGDTLSEGEVALYEKLVEAVEEVRGGPPSGLRRKKRIIPLIGGFLIRAALKATLTRLSLCAGFIALEEIFPADFSDAFAPPCTVDQAACDDDFAVDEACDGSDSFFAELSCSFFHNGAFVCYRSRPSPSGVGTQACYDENRNLITDPRLGGGTQDRTSAWDGFNFGHFFQDVVPYLSCCLLSGPCGEYFERRPTIGCANYSSRPKGFNGGDPHFDSTDGNIYTYNPIGEFILMSERVPDGMTPTFQVQARFGFMTDDEGREVPAQVTVVRQIAIKVGENLLQVEPGPPSEPNMNIYNNYTRDDYTDVPAGEWIQIMPGDPTFTLRRNGPGDISVSFVVAPGCSITLRMRKALGSLIVTYSLSGGACLRGTLTGLLGDFDGDPNNDFRTASGQVLPLDSSQQDIHNIFGNSYRLNRTRSCLRYPIGTDFDDFNDENYEPAFRNDTELLALTGPIEACGDNVLCRFDYVHTLSLEFATATMGVFQEIMEAERIYNASFAPCYGAPCGAGGQCTEDGENFECSCSETFTGTRCETNLDACAGIICQNNGVCRPDNGRTLYLCYCPPGYTGQFCETPVTGVVFSPCRNSTCANSGTCLAVGVDFTCICEEGYTGMTCENAPDPCMSFTCQNGGRCIAISNEEAECECLAGFSGDNCENGSDVCEPNPCQNGGMCSNIDTAPGYECGCPVGFTGELCENEIITDLCGTYPCVNGGTCYQFGSNFTCECVTGYTGDICQSAISICSPSPCYNEGLCNIIDNYPGFQCLCPSGFGGTFCQNADASNPCQSAPCLSGGTCYYDGSEVMCNCLDGYEGQLCDAAADNCSPNPCLNGGVCSERFSPPGYQCGCTAGYSGDTCQDADPNNFCASFPCLNGGTCYYDGTRITCGCRPGYTGQLCGSVDEGPCINYPCENGGRCINRYDDIGYDCICADGFVGRNCENLASGGGCATNPCENRGLCMDTYNNQYRCICHAGFSGTNCQIEDTRTPCRSFPCQNGGVCNFGNGVYYCKCPYGYIGRDCEFDRTGCEIRRCINGGTCSSAAAGQTKTCLCEPGYTGQQCELALDISCTENPCRNGGSCIRRNDAEYCECQDGYYGIHCHISNEQGVRAVTVSVVTYGIVTIILLSVMAGLLCMVNRRNNVKSSIPVGGPAPRIVLRGNF